MTNKYTFKFYPTGFVWTEKGLCNTNFQLYDNITGIRLSIENHMYISIHNEESININLEYEKNTEDIYNDIVNHWLKYLENPNSYIEQYIDKKIKDFVDQFDLFPGGSEYEEAKKDFEKLK